MGIAPLPPSDDTGNVRPGQGAVGRFEALRQAPESRPRDHREEVYAAANRALPIVWPWGAVTPSVQQAEVLCCSCDVGTVTPWG